MKRMSSNKMSIMDVYIQQLLSEKKNKKFKKIKEEYKNRKWKLTISFYPKLSFSDFSFSTLVLGIACNNEMLHFEYLIKL
jgi:hypothetical protein